MSLTIIDKILEKGEYYEDKVIKDSIVIHFTAGSHNPVNTITTWDTDDEIDATTKKKKARVVGTHFVIGGKSTRDVNDIAFDGQVYRAVPETGWIHHLGTKYANNKLLNQKSFGIEICNYGPIKLGADGKYYNYVNSVVPANMVIKLDKPFKGYSYYHDITDKQVESLKELILYLNTKYPTIQLKTPLLDSTKYETSDIAKNGGSGVFVHTNYRVDKFDWPPLPKLINMLKSICKAI